MPQSVSVCLCVLLFCLCSPLGSCTRFHSFTIHSPIARGRITRAMRFIRLSVLIGYIFCVCLLRHCVCVCVLSSDMLAGRQHGWMLLLMFCVPYSQHVHQIHNRNAGWIFPFCVRACMFFRFGNAIPLRVLLPEWNVHEMPVHQLRKFNTQSICNIEKERETEKGRSVSNSQWAWASAFRIFEKTVCSTRWGCSTQQREPALVN